MALLDNTGTGPDAPPAIPGTQIADVAAGGMNAAIGILLALLARERRGEGQYVDVSMTDGVDGDDRLRDHVPLDRGPDARARTLDADRPLPVVSDLPLRGRRHLAIGAVERRFWERSSASTSCRPAWTPLQYDEEKLAEMHAFFEARFAQKSRDAWFEELRPLDVCVAPVLDPGRPSSPST